jgi:NADPH:quinone reductase-like Zn-dependent oxidoreductase
MRLVEREVLPLFEAGELEVPLAGTYPLEEATQAYERFEGGGKLGKIVLLAG